MPSESTPLLQASDARNEDEEVATPLLSQQAATDEPVSKSSKLREILSNHWRVWRGIYLCAIFLFFLELPSDLSQAPILRMIELAVCRRYYEERSIEFGPELPHDMCETDEVQTRVAKLLAILGPLETIPGLVLAVPYGMLADVKGRKFVLGICLVGIIGSSFWSRIVFSPNPILPFWAIYTIPLWQIIGGGTVVLINLILAIIADVAPAEIRTRAFFLVTLENQVTMMVGPPLSAALMTRWGPYVTYLIGAVIISLSLPLLYVLPETSRSKEPRESENSSEIQTASNVPANDTFGRIKQIMSSVGTHVQEEIYPLLKSTLILRGMLIMCIAKFLGSLGGGIMQYMHVRYHWSYEKATSILSYSAGIKLVALSTFLPAMHGALVRYFHDAESGNVALIKISMMLDVIGFIIMGISPAPAGIFVAYTITTIGYGLGPALMSFLTSLVHKNDTAVLYMILTIFGTVGTVLGIPAFQLMLSKGIHFGGLWIGLPYFVGAVLFFFTLLSVLSMKAPEQKERVHEDEE